MASKEYYEGRDLNDLLDKEIIPLWQKNLEPHGVRLPGGPSYIKNKKITKSLGHIIFAYIHKGKIIKGRDSINWIRETLAISVTDDQTLRHMSTQQGLNGRKRNGIMPNGDICKPGEYSLIDLENVYSGWSSKARLNKLKPSGWDDIKTIYNNKCATCGATEGQPHQKDNSTITVLEKGHMDSSKPLEIENIIPQCTLCNKPYKDSFMFDKNGYVVGISNPKIINKSNSAVQKQVYEILKKKYENEKV